MSVGTWRTALQAAGGEAGRRGAQTQPGLDLGGLGPESPLPGAHGGWKGGLIFSWTVGYYQLTFPGILALVFKSEICLQLYLF